MNDLTIPLLDMYPRVIENMCPHTLYMSVHSRITISQKVETTQICVNGTWINEM
jgi:hypothetical protein